MVQNSVYFTLMDKTIKISKETYRKILVLTKQENRTIKAIADRAIKSYAKKVDAYEKNQN